jgi:dTDP-4-dehydrorhamnose reductase
MTTGKVLIIGANGMLGRDMLNHLSDDYSVIGADINEVDIASQTQVDKYVPAQEPGLVVNCAAVSSADECEKDAERAFKVNTGGPVNLAKVCKRLGIPLVHISSDFIFDGTKDTPYREDDPPNPLMIYGETKLASEKEIAKVFNDFIVIRPRWLFGFNDKSFVRFILRKVAEDGPVPIYNAEHACPTYTLDLVDGILNLVDQPARGIYHFSNYGHCDRLEFAREIFDIMGYDKSRLQKVHNKPASWIAERPRTVILSTDKYTRATGKTPRRWQEALKECLEKDTG